MAKEVFGFIMISLLTLSLFALLMTFTVATYLDSIRPHLVKLREERGRRNRKDKITGINFSVDIEREHSSVKDDLSQYRRQA